MYEFSRSAVLIEILITFWFTRCLLPGELISLLWVLGFLFYFSSSVLLKGCKFCYHITVSILGQQLLCCIQVTQCVEHLSGGAIHAERIKKFFLLRY